MMVLAVGRCPDNGVDVGAPSGSLPQEDTVKRRLSANQRGFSPDRARDPRLRLGASGTVRGERLLLRPPSLW